MFGALTHAGFDRFLLEVGIDAISAGRDGGKSLAARATALAQFVLKNPEARTVDGEPLGLRIVRQAVDLEPVALEKARSAFRAALERDGYEIRDGRVEPVAFATIRSIEIVPEFVARPMPPVVASRPDVAPFPSQVNAPDGDRMGTDRRNVFVVHGRNKHARDAMFSFLRSVSLNPMEWEEARRSTNSTAPYIGEVLDSAFAAAQAIVVLLTGDDEARLRQELRELAEPTHELNLTPQARPNVLFEAGLALGRQPKRTILIEIGELRPFSDVAGLHTLKLRTGGAGERNTIVQRLKDAGCDAVTEGRSDWLESPFFADALKNVPASGALASAGAPGTVLGPVNEPVGKPERKAVTRLDQVPAAVPLEQPDRRLHSPVDALAEFRTMVLDAVRKKNRTTLRLMAEAQVLHIQPQDVVHELHRMETRGMISVKEVDLANGYAVVERPE